MMDSKLSFAIYINEKNNSAREGLGIIKHLSPYLPVNTLDQIWKLYSRPRLDFYHVNFHFPQKLNEFDSLFL